MVTESGFASKVFPAKKKQNLPLQVGSGEGRFYSRIYNQSSYAEATSQYAVLYASNPSDQYNFTRIYCLDYTLVWKLLIRTEISKYKSNYLHIHTQFTHIIYTYTLSLN